jgi:hypothetical protein
MNATSGHARILTEGTFIWAARIVSIGREYGYCFDFGLRKTLALDDAMNDIHFEDLG